MLERIFVVGAVLLMTLSGVACGSTDDDDADSSPEEEGPSQELSLGDTATFASGNTVTVYSFTSPVEPTEGLDTPAAAQENPEDADQYEDSSYAAVDVEGCAGSIEATGDPGKPPMLFNRLLFELEGSSPRLFGLLGEEARIEPSTASIAPILGARRLPPEICVRGNVTFEVPPKVIPSHVVFTGFSQERARWEIT